MSHSPNNNHAATLQRPRAHASASADLGANLQAKLQKAPASLEADEGASGRSAEYATHSGAPKSLILVDSVRLSRECLSHLLVSQLNEYDVLSMVHPGQAGETDARPDVVLLNARSARMADASLITDISTLFAVTHRAPILMLSEHLDAHEAVLASESGMAGLFPTACGAALLIAAIRLVAAGGQFFAPPTLIARSHAMFRSAAEATPR